MKNNKIIASVLCALTIYLLTIANQIYAPIICEIIFGENIIHYGVLLILLFYIFIPLLAIIVPVIIFEKKFNFCKKNIYIISAMMYIFFAIYEPPSWYLLVNTASSATGYYSDSGFNGWHRDILPSPIASILITIEYTIIILITLYCLKVNNK